MATAAFKSTTKRTQIGSQENANNNNSNNPAKGASKPAGGHRRSRSLSRFGRYSSGISSSSSSVLRQIDILNNDQELNNKPPSRNVSPPRGSNMGPFVNTVRGSSTFLDSPDTGRSDARRGRPISRHQKESATDSHSETEKLQRRGRSVNRNDAFKHTINPPDNGRRRQRSLSVARHHQYSDSTSENDMDPTYNWTGSNRSYSNAIIDGQRQISEKLSGGDVPKPQHELRRCSSQTDLSRSYDDYSSYGSSLTDDEGLDVTHSDHGEEKIIRAVYAQMKSLRSDHPTGEMEAVDLLEAMRSEVRHAIAELKSELKQTSAKNTLSTTSKGSNDLHKPKSADVRKNYTSKLEQSEKRTRNLRTELALEERRRQELAKILKELLSGPKPAQMERPSRRRRNSADRKQLSKSLNEEAEKYIDEFLSMPNIEDSEFSSSFEEEQYNAGAHGRKIEDNGLRQESLLQIPNTEKCSLSTQHVPLSVEDDGVVLPWLQWETNPDSPTQFSRADLEAVITEKTLQHKIPEEMGSNSIFDGNIAVTSSNYSSGSWTTDSNYQYDISKLDSSIVSSPNLSSTQNSSVTRGQEYSSNLRDSVKPQHDYDRFRKSAYQDDEYILRVKNEAILMEKLKFENRIKSGGMILCTNFF